MEGDLFKHLPLEGPLQGLEAPCIERAHALIGLHRAGGPPALFNHLETSPGHFGDSSATIKSSAGGETQKNGTGWWSRLKNLGTYDGVADHPPLALTP